jgi:hypothetical protein
VALLHAAQIEEHFRCALVVAIFTMRQLRRICSWISARIQCTAKNQPYPSIGSALHGLHQPDVAFLNQVCVRQAIPQIPTGDRRPGEDAKAPTDQQPPVVLVSSWRQPHFLFLESKGKRFTAWM